MNINYLDIQITDTQENNRLLSLEDASVDSIKLVYNGQDDKFATILPSELQFTFLVKDSTTVKYFHLFTGSETRYKVELVDVSVVNYPKPIWVGFLLPEQFKEPYKNGGFFVHFVATDGVARLKSKDFNITAKESVLEVLNTCLKLTGLKLPIYFSEAFQNKGFVIDYLDLCIDTTSYLENDKVKSSYDVLNEVLKSIGCVIFLYKNAWFIIGLNKFKEKTISFNYYTLNGSDSLVFDSKINITRDVLTSKFLANPEVNVLPPLQKMEVIWSAATDKFLLPEDVLANGSPFTLFTDKSVVLVHHVYGGSDVAAGFGGYIATSNNEEVVKGFASFYRLEHFNSDLDLADLDTNYLTSTVPFYVNGSEDVEKYGTLEIDLECNARAVDGSVDYFNNKGEFTNIVDNGSGKGRIVSIAHGLVTGDEIVLMGAGGVYEDLQQVVKVDVDTFDISEDFAGNYAGDWKINPFKGVFYFAVTRKDHLNQSAVDEVIYLSNFSTDARPNGYFDFNIDLERFIVKCKLKIDKMLFTTDGYYNIRLYPNISHPFIDNFWQGNGVKIKKLNFTYQTESEISLVKQRSVDYTTSHNLNVFHSASRMNTSKRSFLFSDNLMAEIENANVVPGVLDLNPVSLKITPVFIGGVDTGAIEIKLVVTATDYNYLLEGYSLNVLKDGETVSEEVVMENYTKSYNASTGEYVVTQFKNVDSVGVFIEATDYIFLKSGTTSASLSYGSYWLDKWKRYDVVESNSMSEVLVDMYHSLLSEANFMVMGTYLQLVSPLDLVLFNFNQEAEFYPVNLELNLHKNTTQLTMIESKNQPVTDYE